MDRRSECHPGALRRCDGPRLVYPAGAMPRRAPAKHSGPQLAAEARCLRLGDREVPLYSGAVHYFRHPRSRWGAILEGLRATGMPMVETYVPWAVHELERGRFDFGEVDPSTDLGAFLDLAWELDLLVFVRPGPHINAELTHFGIPERVLFDPACQALSPTDAPLPLPAPPRMFPVPSCASAAFRAEVRTWFDAVGRVVAPRIWPNGPVVLLQVDNEASLYFRDGPYDQDFHADAQRAYRDYLRRRYEHPTAAGNAHGLPSVEDWNVLVPPRRFEPPDGPPGLRRHLDWARFQGELLLESITDHGRALADAGLGALPTVHNVPMGDAGLPYSLAEMDRRVDITGLDYYESARNLPRVKRRTLRLAGSVRMPHSPELGVGVPPWFGPRTGADALSVALCALAHGLRGFNLYMAADRDRWWGALLNGAGEPNADGEVWTRLLRSLSRLGFHRLEREVEVALSVPAEYAQLSRVTHTLGAASPSVMALATGNPTAACRAETFGLQDAVQRAWWPLLERTAAALTAAGVPYVYVDSGAELPTGVRVVVAPVYGFADRARMEQLAAFEAAGGHVVHGPRTPDLDADMLPMGQTPSLARPPTELPDEAAASALVASLERALPLRRPGSVAPAPLELAVHASEGKPKVVFIINPGGGQANARISLDGQPPLLDVLSGEHFTLAGTGGIPMAPRSVRMLEVRRPKPASRRGRPSARRGGSS